MLDFTGKYVPHLFRHFADYCGEKPQLHYDDVRMKATEAISEQQYFSVENPCV